MKKETKKAVGLVLNAPHRGGSAMSYTVHYTAERVMLVLDAVPKSHLDALKDLIARQTDDRWQEDPELAAITGATLALGLPDALESLRQRLAAMGIDLGAEQVTQAAPLRGPA